MVDSAVNKVVTAEDKASVVVVKVDKLATPAVVTATCPVIAPKDRNVTTVVKSVT